MSALERRLAKLEDASYPQPVQPFCLLVEPLTDATPEAWDEHRQKVEAKARGDFVAVVSSVRPGDRAHGEKDVTYFASEFEARLVEASMLPSERGNDSLLADVLQDTMGNVIGPVAFSEPLYWQAGIANPNGGKPKGMHWRTFNRLTAEHDAFVGVSLVETAKRLRLRI